MIVLLLDRRWVFACALFAAATLNRETTFVLIVFAAMLDIHRNGRLSKPAVGALAVMIVSWLTIKALLYALLPPGHGSDGIAVAQIGFNLAMFLKPWQWPNIALTIIPPILFAQRLIRIRREAPEWPWLATFVACYPIFFTFAFIIEHRAFADLIPYAAVGAMAFLPGAAKPTA